MASVGAGPESKGGRGKSLDAEINLVPFIDLLSMCICFLLMTAVWIEIGSVQVKQSQGTEASAEANTGYEINVQFMAPGKIHIALKKSGKAFIQKDVQSNDSQAFLNQLDTLLKTFPKNITAAMLTPKQGVTYGEMVSVMDVLRKNQIVNLGIVPTSTN